MLPHDATINGLVGGTDIADLVNTLALERCDNILGPALFGGRARRHVNQSHGVQCLLSVDTADNTRHIGSLCDDGEDGILTRVIPLDQTRSPGDRQRLNRDLGLMQLRNEAVQTFERLGEQLPVGVIRTGRVPSLGGILRVDDAILLLRVVATDVMRLKDAHDKHTQRHEGATEIPIDVELHNDIRPKLQRHGDLGDVERKLLAHCPPMGLVVDPAIAIDREADDHVAIGLLEDKGRCTALTRRAILSRCCQVEGGHDRTNSCGHFAQRPTLTCNGSALEPGRVHLLLRRPILLLTFAVQLVVKVAAVGEVDPALCPDSALIWRVLLRWQHAWGLLGIRLFLWRGNTTPQRDCRPLGLHCHSWVILVAGVIGGSAFETHLT